jgi:hypothetical protein
MASLSHSAIRLYHWDDLEVQAIENALKLNEVHTLSQTSDELMIYIRLFVKRKLASSQTLFEIGSLIVVVLSKRIFIPTFQ